MRASPFTRAAWRGVRGAELHVGHQVGQDDQLDAGLAERGQHLLDVAQEDPVGTDHEDALVLQREPVGVEEVGGPVQRHHRLAGAGTALDHEDARLRGADDLVLLGLDGADDVAELAGAAGLQRGQQGRVARQAAGLAGDAEVALAEQLVLDGEELAALGGEVPPPGQAHRVAAGGPVEGLGHRRPPVDDDRLPLLVGHRQPADVVRLDARWSRRGPARRSPARSMRPKTRAACPRSSWVRRVTMASSKTSRS